MKALFFGTYVLSLIRAPRLVEILDCVLRLIAFSAPHRDCNPRALRRMHPAAASLFLPFSSPYYPMDLYPRVLYRSAKSAKVLFLSTKANEHGDAVQEMLRRLELGLRVDGDPVRTDYAPGFTGTTAFRKIRPSASVSASSSCTELSEITHEIHERPMELGWVWDAHEHAKSVRWRRRIARRDGSGPAWCRPAAPGRSERWGRVKPWRGSRAHTSETAPVCAARVSAPNL